ncbi:MAG: hypothetical protein KC493_15240 [Bacteriovoracaceae bacterium]|nr:hypothetical protein [Bacteriovoracaceae bacterium]
MKIDVDFDNDTESVMISFFPKEFNSKRDFSLSLNIIQTFCGDFDLDPELEIEDIAELMKTMEEREKEFFVFIINEDGIEVDLKNYDE